VSEGEIHTCHFPIPARQSAADLSVSRPSSAAVQVEARVLVLLSSVPWQTCAGNRIHSRADNFE
jgi:hypothetical protein